MNKIKETRIEKGYSQKDLANALKVNQTAVSQWERGVTLPTSSTLTKLSKLLDASCDYLLGISEQKQPYVWNNMEALRAIPEGEGLILQSFLESVFTQDSKIQHNVFTILEELGKIINTDVDKTLAYDQADKQKLLLVLDVIAQLLRGLTIK